jgi:2-keto-4-pentenoate hydratase/2-oxohepta-3-ene-1,7-dioic acid hydratase in catechol pathway
MQKQTRREMIGTALAASAMPAAAAPSSATRFVRFRKGSVESYGILDNDTVRTIQGGLFGSHKETGAKYKLADVKLLAPCTPSKVLAVGLNYKSHVGEQRKPPSNPEIFYKPITCLQHPEEPIVIPADAKNVHYEGELVIVIGRKASNISVAEAKDVIFGVTCGNDVSERDWQGGPQKDLQWWRAKGADTFGPLGPVVVRGIDYGNVLLQTRLNGNVVQKQSTSELIFDCPTIVSFVSRYVTLAQGDIIYTGTPGHTSKMSPGDTVEVDIENVGVLRNRIEASRAVS